MDRQTQTQRLTEHWQPILKAWQQSGQSQKAYCEQQALNYHQFTYWRRKLSHDETQSAQQSSSALVPVVYTPKTGLSLSLPNGMELHGLTLDNLPVVEQLLRRL